MSLIKLAQPRTPCDPSSTTGLQSPQATVRHGAGAGTQRRAMGELSASGPGEEGERHPVPSCFPAKLGEWVPRPPATSSPEEGGAQVFGRRGQRRRRKGLRAASGTNMAAAEKGPGWAARLNFPPPALTGISRDNWHKRRKTGGKRKPYHKKRKYELGRPAANTKIGPRRIHTVRVRGGNKKYRALRLDVGNFSWGSECCTRKTRIIDVVYNASNNELVRTKTLVKNCIVLVDSTPYRQWYESHYALPLGRKKGAKLTPEEEEILNKKRSKKIQKKYDERKKNAKISSLLEEQFQQGKLLACIASRPGQCGRADGYVLEGKELEFYLRKIKARKGK
ncbi:40S ribosomal protein S8 [Manis pentadactyla]|nr:40S ribosomal protein S8 [Manis pentadactyla]